MEVKVTEPFGGGIFNFFGEAGRIRTWLCPFPPPSYFAGPHDQQESWWPSTTTGSFFPGTSKCWVFLQSACGSLLPAESGNNSLFTYNCRDVLNLNILGKKSHPSYPRQYPRATMYGYPCFLVCMHSVSKRTHLAIKMLSSQQDVPESVWHAA